MEKEEEEDSTMRNDSLINKKKNDIKNQSDIIFNQNKKINFNNKNKKFESESKKDENPNDFDKPYDKIKDNIDIIIENPKKTNIFNNYIAYRPKNIVKSINKLNTINYIGSRNNDTIFNNFKSSFNNIQKNKNSPYNINNRYDKLNPKEENLRDKILYDNINNENNQKISLPNLNKIDNQRSVSSIKKYNKINIDKFSPKENTHNSLKKYSSHSNNHYNYLKSKNENFDNYKIDLLSTISKKSNIIIPIISSQNKLNNLNYMDNYMDNNNESKETNNYKNINNTNIKTFNGLKNNIEENNKNNMNEMLQDSSNKIKLLKKINKKIIMENNNLNLLMNIDHSFITKLHKIKIEKGATGDKIFESLNKNLLNKEYNGLATFGNYTINSKLPLINQIHDRKFNSKRSSNKMYK